MSESLTAQAVSLAEELRNLISRTHPEILASCPVEGYIAGLDSDPGYGGYGKVPAAVRATCRQIEEATGAGGLARYHRLVLATLITRFETCRSGGALPASVKAQYQVEFGRILKQLGGDKSGFYLHGNDLFSKDLALCRGKLLPCGAQLVDVCSGVPRRIVLNGGVGQFLRGSAFFGLSVGGFRPFFEMHLDPRSLAQFSPEGWDRCYLRIADLLETRPEILGVFGSSWWFDPVVEKITPNLAYLRQRPLGAGARIFRVGSDQAAVGNSTRFSKLRKSLYEEGKYLPTNYLMAWGRRDLLDWARRARAQGQEA